MPVIIAILIVGIWRSPVVNLEQLGKVRAVFDAKVDTQKFWMGAQIGAMPFRWQSCAYHPLGDASRRYMLMNSEHSARLFCEARHGSKYPVDWCSNFRWGKRRVSRKALLPAVLHMRNAIFRAEYGSPKPGGQVYPPDKGLLGIAQTTRQ
jgi:hypothetical protein